MAARLFQQAANLYRSEPPDPSDNERDYGSYWEGHAMCCQDIADRQAQTAD